MKLTGSGEQYMEGGSELAQNTPRHHIFSTKEIYYPKGKTRAKEGGPASGLGEDSSLASAGVGF